MILQKLKIVFSETLKNKFVWIITYQVVRPNLYKSLMKYLYLFILYSMLFIFFPLHISLILHILSIFPSLSHYLSIYTNICDFNNQNLYILFLFFKYYSSPPSCVWSLLINKWHQSLIYVIRQIVPGGRNDFKQFTK